jgi:hypothetical protein
VLLHGKPDLDEERDDPPRGFVLAARLKMPAILEATVERP